MPIKISMTMTIISHSILLIHLTAGTAAAAVGVCYGRVATDLLAPAAVINILKSNGISRIRLFNPDSDALAPFRGTGIELIIGVPNEMLSDLANGGTDAAVSWLQSNIFKHVEPKQVRYLAAGNEVLLKEPFNRPFVVPAIVNLHNALQKLGLEDAIKLSTPHATAILSTSHPPSAGEFHPDLRPIMVPLLEFLRRTRSPLMVNVYPYFSYINNRGNVTLDYALFRSPTNEIDKNLVYTNLFDATIDAFVYAMEREGFDAIPVVVTETGWPTAGGEAADADNAMAYNGNVVIRAQGRLGTPKRPGAEIEVLLFDLFDENQKSGEAYERHFGIFEVNGAKAYDLRFN